MQDGFYSQGGRGADLGTGVDTGVMDAMQQVEARINCMHLISTGSPRGQGASLGGDKYLLMV